MERSSEEVPEAFRVRFEPASSMFEAMVGVVARLLFTEVTPLVMIRLPAVMLMAAVPPVPLKVTVFSVLLPTSVRVPAPLTIKLLVLAMVPLVL